MAGNNLNPLQAAVVLSVIRNDGMYVLISDEVAIQATIENYVDPSVEEIKKFQQIFNRDKITGNKLPLVEDGIPGLLTQFAIWEYDNRIYPVPNKKFIRDVYGNFKYSARANGRIVQDATFAELYIQTVNIPRRTGDVRPVRLNKALAFEFPIILKAACVESNYWPSSIQSYVPRYIGWNIKNDLSNHSWGIAIDFDPTLNPMGGKQANGKPSMFRTLEGEKFLAMFRKFNYSCGADWKIRDDMHIERVAR